MIRPGDFVRHKDVEQALHVESIDGQQAWCSAPSPDGWPFPVRFALPVENLKRIANPIKRQDKSSDDDFEPAPF